MATLPIGGTSSPVITPYVAFYPEPGTRQHRFLVQGYVDREQIAAAAAALVDLLDDIDGDPDVELNGDEADGTGSEDDFIDHLAPYSMRGPGCPIADPDTCVDDEGEYIDEREMDYADGDSGEFIPGGGSGA